MQQLTSGHDARTSIYDMKTQTTPGVNGNARIDYLTKEEKSIVEKLYKKLWYDAIGNSFSICGFN